MKKREAGTCSADMWITVCYVAMRLQKDKLLGTFWEVSRLSKTEIIAYVSLA